MRIRKLALLMLIITSFALLAACNSSESASSEDVSANGSEVLENYGWSVNEADFITAITVGETEAVTYMLEQGIDPDTLDSLGSPAMYTAITFDQADIIALLIEYGADTAYTNEYGVNYMYFAAINQQANSTLQALIDGGVDLYHVVDGSNSLDAVLSQLNAYGGAEWQRVADYLTAQGLSPSK